MFELVIQNAIIHTMDPHNPRATWIGISHGLVLDLGSGEAPPGQEILDAKGQLLVPGFNDAHCHTGWFGLSLAEIDCKKLGSLEEVYDALSSKARLLGPGEWVLAQGYNQEAFGGLYPDIAVLDALLPENPVFLRHTSGHACIVNTKALTLAGFAESPSLEVQGGVIVRDSAGNPTGVLEERAQSVVQELLLPKSQEELVAALDRATAVYATEGITSFTETGIAGGWIGFSPLEFGAYQTARARGVLRSRAQLMVVSDVLHPAAGHREDPHGLTLDAGIRTGLGDDRLSLGPMKIFLDGSMLAWTGAMSAPFAAGPANNYGYFQADEADLVATMMEAAASGWAIGAHAIGDRAVELALTTFDTALALHGPPLIPHRIEHGGVVTDAQAARAAALGVAIITQPGFMPELGVQMAQAMGEERTALIHRHQGLIAAGVMVGGSSDRPVATGRPLEIIHAMVDRRASDGAIIGPQERVSVHDAFWTYTVGSAQATGQADRKGMLKPGYLADMVVLSKNPLDDEVAAIRDIDVVHTLVGGHFTLRDGVLSPLPG